MQAVFEKIIKFIEKEIERTSSFSEHDTQINIMDYVKQEAEKYAPDTNVGNNGWIPVSERLPSDCAIHEVTAQFSNGKAYTEFAYYDEAKEEWWKHDDDGLVNVIAWKEPSEPYKPKGE